MLKASFPATLALVFSVSVFFGLPSLAIAQQATSDPTEQAKSRAAQADEHFSAGRYGDAVAEYEAAYRLKRDSSFLFHIAGAHRKAGNLVDALAAYQRLIAAHPDTPFLSEANGYIAELRTKLELQASPKHPALSKSAGDGAADIQAVIDSLGPPVTVQFASGLPGQEYQIRLLHGKLEQARGGHLAKECQTPCSVETFAGNNTLQVTGPESFYQSVILPAYPSSAEVIHGQTTMRYIGMGFVSTGGLLALTGFSLFAYYPLDKGVSAYATLGSSALLAIIGGVIWGVARHNSITVSPKQASAGLGTRGPRLLSVALAPTAQGALVGATFSF